MSLFSKKAPAPVDTRPRVDVIFTLAEVVRVMALTASLDETTYANVETRAVILRCKAAQAQSHEGKRVMLYVQ